MKTIKIFSKEDLREWFQENHIKEKKLLVILHKKHTGKKSPSHREQIEEAICFGWIDTIVRRIDEDVYSREFSKRNKKSSWSNNTISYGEKVFKKGIMSKEGEKFFKLGLKKPTLDYGIPKKPEMPEILKEAFLKNKKAKEKFDLFSPSIKRTFYRQILLAKLPETRIKRVKEVIEKAEENNRQK